MDDDNAERLRQFAQAFLPTRLSSRTNVFVTPRIPAKKLRGARNSFVDRQDGDGVLVLYDETVFGSAKVGFAITNKALVYNLAQSGTEPTKIKAAFRLRDIRTIEFKKLHFGCDVIVNGEQLFNATSLNGKDARALQELFDRALAGNFEVARAAPVDDV